MLYRGMKPANQVLERTALSSLETVVRSTLRMTLITIQRLSQLLQGIATICERATARINRRRGEKNSSRCRRPWGRGKVTLVCCLEHLVDRMR